MTVHQVNLIDNARAKRLLKGVDLMSRQVSVEIEMPATLNHFKLPPGVNQRLQELLDRQDKGETLTESERREAEGLVDLAEFLSLLRLRSNRVWQEQEKN